MESQFTPHHTRFPHRALNAVLRHYLLACIDIKNKTTNFNLHDHYCSFSHPCRIIFLELVCDFLVLRLVSSEWNHAVSLVLLTLNRSGNAGSSSALGDLFFRRVEAAYYPHLWHINTIVRKHTLFGRYRVCQTISSDSGDRGVYRAYDFGASNLGCLSAETVFIKAWSNSDDPECLTEKLAYESLQAPYLISGVPAVLKNARDDECGVFAIVLQRLGPTLDDLLQMLPDHKFDERMVLSVAIQMLDRYKEIHSRQIIHNGIKPANICLPPRSLSSSGLSLSANRSADKNRAMLYAIDFGLSFFMSKDELLPGERRADTIGNRCFLSIFGHHGITQSQRDDLESLGYLLSFLRHGRLPWSQMPIPTDSLRKLPRLLSSNSSQDQDSKSRPQIWRIKMASPASTLFQGMDPCFVEFWKDVKGLAFGEIPDYDSMKERFVDCWHREKLDGLPGEYDWWALVDELT